MVTKKKPTDVVEWAPVVITLPLPPKQLSPNSRGKWTKSHPKVKAYRKLAMATVIKSGAVDYGWEFAESQETFYFPDRTVRDIRNFEAMLKPVYDGFRDAGLIVDDSCKHLQFAQTKFRISKVNPRVEITLTKTTMPDDIYTSET